jgi:hypothetical protein
MFLIEAENACAEAQYPSTNDRMNANFKMESVRNDKAALLAIKKPAFARVKKISSGPGITIGTPEY